MLRIQGARLSYCDRLSRRSFIQVGALGLGVVATSLPGVQFSELMAQQARIMDKLAIIRSVHHDSSSQVIGSSNDKGEVPADNPYRPENVLAMIYRHLGIDSSQTFLDLTGRPRYLLEHRQLIRELA
ncbi:MAG: DUF1501 domain-containing protein [Pirellulaceae bacterium]|nr:DUF1501 domain-containing protein [Pirellulaceae bacterium]